MCTHLETSSHKVLCIVIIRERRQLIVRQVCNAICLKDDGIEESICHHR